MRRAGLAEPALLQAHRQTQQTADVGAVARGCGHELSPQHPLKASVAPLLTRVSAVGSVRC